MSVSDVTPAEAREVFGNSLARHGRPPSMREVAEAFACVGRHVNQRTLRKWRRDNWSDEARSPFAKAIVTFTEMAAGVGVDLMVLIPELREIRPVASADVLDAYEGSMKRRDAMKMAQLLEENARTMIKTSLHIQDLITQHAKQMLLEKPTGLSQVLRSLGIWNEFAHNSVDGVVMLRERSMKLNVPPSATNVVPFKPWAPDDPLTDVR